MAKAIHAMIRVLEEQRSLDFYDKAFGLKPSYRLDFPSFTLIYLRNAESDFELELTVNKDRAEPYTHGDGYGHIAVVVDDLAAEHARFKAAGLNPLDIKEFAPDGNLIARFFFVQDPDGYKIEVLQRHGHYV
ncbi:lactoylglutathione lyase [Rhodoblastus acidophilus]|uniref:VOC family protein n=1 Tax=Rhodoblastus acidophilus TaxID=1074 RepID=UPI002224F78F|nr:VOC family protein [Rhodoblastus acidophilus]MCW2286238.1 lactoylglutathione lyase [Rhodoblastus acidophilus]MCW2335182.1 lactoylglutathione lyase [Rhodoblastus acidophilus]